MELVTIPSIGGFWRSAAGRAQGEQAATSCGATPVLPSNTFNVYNKDGLLFASNPLAEDCGNWSTYTLELPYGISAFEYSYIPTPAHVEGNTAIDNVNLCFPLFRDGFESNDTSEWSSATSP
jgi:hypothetical protein